MKYINKNEVISETKSVNNSVTKPVKNSGEILLADSIKNEMKGKAYE
jgi:hypothetical protein